MMNPSEQIAESNSNLARLQSVVRESGLDGWLLYDFRGLNPFPAQLLNLGRVILSRRWFLFVPAQDRATLICHRIEAGNWQQLLPDPAIHRQVFSAHQELDQALRVTLTGARRIAMEISPRGQVPYVSYVDAGTVERVRECGVEIVSSADLLQNFVTWSEEDRQAHLAAVQGVIRAKDVGFGLIHERLCARQPITELEVQDAIVRELTCAGLEFDHPAIVAFGSHASDGHYSVTRESNRVLEPGMCVILDIWAGLRDRPMADITWVGFAGAPTAEYLRVWEAVRDARDLALDLLTRKRVAEGWQVDRAARDLIAARGYGAAFRHRLGHSLGRNFPHGPAVNLDDLETHDTRKLLPGLGVTVEPGVYLGHIGIRSEVNVLITSTGAQVTTPVQAEPYRLGVA
jgi:Xaa-Pro aminopeptidase